MNIRKQIRQEIKALLNNDEHLVGDRVFTSRRVPAALSSRVLDGLIIITCKDESATTFNQSPRQKKRIAKFSIIIVKQLAPNSDEEIEDSLDDLSSTVEDKIIRWESSPLKDLISDIDYDGCDMQVDEESGSIEGRLGLNYSITYYTDEVVDESELDILDSHKVEILQNLDNSFRMSVEHE